MKTNSTPQNQCSLSVFRTPILSPDENTVVFSPYQIPKTRKLSNIMCVEPNDQENYNYHNSKKLFFKRKSPEKHEKNNFTNKILERCQNSSVDLRQFQENPLENHDFSAFSEKEEFCSENLALHNDFSLNSHSDEFSVASMPAKLENSQKIEKNSLKNSRISNKLEKKLFFDEPNENLEVLLEEIENLRLQNEELLQKNQQMCEERRNEVSLMENTTKELKKCEFSLNKYKKENKQLKIRIAELEMVLKELLFDKETKKLSGESENVRKIKGPLQNITNL